MYFRPTTPKEVKKIINNLKEHAMSGTDGIRTITLKNNITESYLPYRKQYTVVNNVKSMLESILCGVAEGCLLGHLLFLLFVNDNLRGFPAMYAGMQ